MKTLKQLREKKFNTLAEFAKAVGVSVPTACRWERGYTYPNLTQIKKIASVLGLSSFEIFIAITKENDNF